MTTPDRLDKRLDEKALEAAAGIVEANKYKPWTVDSALEIAKGVVRAYLESTATPVPGVSEAMVERAAKAYYVQMKLGFVCPPWDVIDAKEKEYYRANVRAALEAAVQSPPAGGRAKALEEQPAFTYYECPECGFDCIHPADYEPRSTACPMCAGDSGHDVGMRSRVARSTDKPEGKDARHSAAPVEAVAIEPIEGRSIGEAIINASNASEEALAIDGQDLVLSPPYGHGAVKIDLKKLAAALTQEAVATEPVAWECVFPTYGHFTLKKQEAEQAKADGAIVKPLGYLAPTGDSGALRKADQIARRGEPDWMGEALNSGDGVYRP